MEPETAILNFLAYNDGEYESPQLVSQRLDSLLTEDQRTLFRYILDHFKVPVVEEILAANNYYSPEKIKEVKGIRFTHKDKIYAPHGYSFKEFSLGKTLSDYELSQLGNDFYVKVSPPKSILDQIDAHRKRFAAKQAQKEEKKKLSKIKRAEKLLKEAGKL